MDRQKKVVKVRINASGKRIIGIISVPPPHFRVSDYLNSHDEFLLVKQDKTDIALLKNSISYIEALEEGDDTGSRPKNGSFHPVTVTLRNHAGTVEGELFVPDGNDLIGTLNRIRRFINLKKVHFVNSPERYAFLAIGKQEIIQIQEISRIG